jgi:hypothetical protein
MKVAHSTIVGEYLFADSTSTAEAERQLTVRMNRLVPEQLDDKNYMSSIYEVNLCPLYLSLKPESPAHMCVVVRVRACAVA